MSFEFNQLCSPAITTSNLPLVTFTKGVSWPKRCYLQVRTHVSAIELVDKINGIYESHIDWVRALQSQSGDSLSSDELKQSITFDKGWKTYFDERGLVKKEPEETSLLISLTISKEVNMNMNNLLCKSLPPSAPFYFKSMLYVEKILKDRSVAELKPSGLLGLFNNIHTLIAQLSRHSYRTKDVIVFKANILNAEDVSFVKIDSYMKAVCKGSDLASWENSLSKKMAINPLNITKQGHKLSSNDRQLLHKYLAALTPAYEQVPALMTIFSEELSAKLKSCSDLIELMAWCHQKIVEIHPYEDGNGRVARLAMNILAIQGGRSPILFDNEANYLRAVDNASIEKFTTYLRSLVALQNELEPFTQDCFQFFFEELRRLYNF